MLALIVLGHHDRRRMMRRLHAAERIARRLRPDLVVLCGAGEAQAMALHWRVKGPLLVLDTRSTSTATNVLEASGWLQAHGCLEAMLITSSWHMPRAMAAMREAAPLVTLSSSRMVDPIGIRCRSRERRLHT